MVRFLVTFLSSLPQGVMSAVDPVQLPVQWLPGSLSLGLKLQDVKFSIHLHLVLRARMGGAILHCPLYVFMDCIGTN